MPRGKLVDTATLCANHARIRADLLGSNVACRFVLVALVDQAVAASKRNADCGRRNARTRKQGFDDAIAEAAKVVPLARLDLPQAVNAVWLRISHLGPDVFGLERVPSKRTIRRVVRALQGATDASFPAGLMQSAFVATALEGSHV
mgnify:CR=1 FL=1